MKAFKSVCVFLVVSSGLFFVSAQTNQILPLRVLQALKEAHVDFLLLIKEHLHQLKQLLLLW
jgi:hypothetical protein